MLGLGSIDQGTLTEGEGSVLNSLLDQLLFLMQTFFLLSKTSYLNKEVNRTEPSLSVSVPCIDSWCLTLLRSSPNNYITGSGLTPMQGIVKGKYHCTFDLLFDWFGISCMTRQFLILFAKQTNPKQSNRRSTVQ